MTISNPPLPNLSAELETTQKLQDWLEPKIKLAIKTNNPPSTKEGEIRWTSVGQNIGSEIYGKGTDYMRTVVIYKKLSKYTFLVIPTSTKIKIGSWYSYFVHNKKEMVAMLSQIKVIDYRRLQRSIGQLDSKDFAKLKSDFDILYK